MAAKSPVEYTRRELPGQEKGQIVSMPYFSSHDIENLPSMPLYESLRERKRKSTAHIYSQRDNFMAEAENMKLNACFSMINFFVFHKKGLLV